MTAEKAREITKRAIENQATQAKVNARKQIILEHIEACCKKGEYTLTQDFYFYSPLILSIVVKDLIALGYYVTAKHSWGNFYELRINWREF